MSKLTINYEQSRGYDEKIELNIKIQQQPSDVDYKIITDLVAQLDVLANKYLTPRTDLDGTEE